MGLFKKKKRKEEDAFVCDSPTRGGQADGSYGAQQDVARLKEAGGPDPWRLSTQKPSLDTERGSDFGDADIKSSSLKVRLRKSLSQIFTDKTQVQKPQPPLPSIPAEVYYLRKELRIVI